MSKRSIVPSKRHSNFLIVSEPECTNLITYALSIAYDINDNESKFFNDAMNSFNSSNWMNNMLVDINSLN